MGDLVHQIAPLLNAMGKFFLAWEPFQPECLTIAFKGKVAFHNFHTFTGSADTANLHR